MADIQDALQKLFSDPESMKKVTDLAAGLAPALQKQDAAPSPSPDFGGLGALFPSPAQTPKPPSEEPKSGDLSSLLASLGKSLSSPPAGNEQKKEGGLDLSSLFSLFGKGSSSAEENTEKQRGMDPALLPRLMMAFSGDANYLKPEKVNLLRALKPYLGQRRAPDIDRAVKMANLARAAQEALGGLERR
ncbi:hypothetical protein [Intestinimonas butyriciproducens]|uniref:hypothetical protein n=1 Tax=Intestinimonas butyriciproducens TaxID=1297617 RepID=UPI001959B83B|nr:hypothetical protein [Intestinimonas butyriciproducens]MBM6918454.1 hypothetical protein [Intestinimonas butyriciproducens]